MNNISSNTSANPKLEKALKEIFSDYSEVSLISVATTDGFSIKALAKMSLGVELDKIAAMASSLNAISNSSSLQLMESDAIVTTIESDAGNILLMSSEYFGKSTVLTMVADNKLSLAQGRFLLARLAETISSIE